MGCDKRKAAKRLTVCWVKKANSMELTYYRAMSASQKSQLLECDLIT